MIKGIWNELDVKLDNRLDDRVFNFVLDDCKFDVEVDLLEFDNNDGKFNFVDLFKLDNDNGKFIDGFQ